MTAEHTEPCTVLVIDEDANALDASRAALEKAGYRVLTRNRSAGSISVIIKEKPDVVLVDLNKARLTGETIAKIINKTQPRPKVVLLLYSALPVETLRLKALASGAQGYVQKTDDAADLVQRLDSYLTSGKALGRSRLLTSSASGDDAPEPPIERTPPDSDPHGALGETTVTGRRDPTAATPRPRAVKTLFVDDNWSLLRSYRSAIGSELEAEFLTSGEEAVQRILSDSPPDIVVCDIVMPFVTGADLYSRAVAADPSWRERFLLITGASSTRVVADFLNEHDGHVLFKPVPSNRLLDAIRKLESSAVPRVQGPR